MTEDTLKAQTRKQLTVLARRHRVGGWHSMKKEELIKAILKARNHQLATQAERKRRRHLTAGNDDATNAGRRDRLAAEALDSHWLHATWEISHAGIRRVQAALKSEWHQAVPVLRVYDVTRDEHASATRRLVSQIEVRTDTNRWFVPVDAPPRSYELEIGYRVPSGRFQALARSRRVGTSRPGSRPTRVTDSFLEKQSAGNGARSTLPKDRPMAGTPEGLVPPSVPLPRRSATEGNGHAVRKAVPPSGRDEEEFEFHIEAELVVHGETHPCAETTLMGQTVHPASDGTFSLRMNIPDGRQIIPVAAITPDGKTRRTIVLSIERNTRELEPQSLLDEF